MSQLTVALLGKSLIDWGGGIDFLRNCANALLHAEADTSVQPLLLLPKATFQSEMGRYAKPLKNMAKELLSLKLPGFYWEKPVELQSVIDSFQNLNGDLPFVLYADSFSGLRKGLQETGADVVLPVSESLGRSFPIPWLGYVPDVQHRHLPQYFTPLGCRIRDMKIRKLLSEAKGIIVNSRNAGDDLEKFYGAGNCRIFALPFAPLPVEEWFEDGWEECRIKYTLPERFFLISNQFWVHKSHITAFDALAEVAKQHDVHILCTGKPGDPRAPGYYDELLRKICDLSLEQRVHILGYIPKKDQIQIMKKAVAVIQPTLFEGGPGGGAVYDAVALGVPAIISDIPVNREIDEEGVSFFTTGSSADLALKMSEILVRGPRHQEPSDWLREKGKIRAERLAAKLVEAVEFVVNAQEPQV